MRITHFALLVAAVEAIATASSLYVHSLDWATFFAVVMLAWLYIAFIERGN